MRKFEDVEKRWGNQQNEVNVGGIQKPRWGWSKARQTLYSGCEGGRYEYRCEHLVDVGARSCEMQGEESLVVFYLRVNVKEHTSLFLFMHFMKYCQRGYQ